MDRRSILIKLKEALSIIEDAKNTISFLNDDVIKLEVISDIFRNLTISKRIDIVSNAIIDLSTTDLIDFNFTIIALTQDEVDLGVKENNPISTDVSSKDGQAASSI